ncbi:MAG: polysaccharide biosynthesis tyrosine autokinase [Calothrix sp. C42_A2020_038]|nr:polysaccharide biosynthesis tyrosine autokinase [Calothrix sp. C42_A2020_038]
MQSKENFEEIDFQKYWLVLQRRWLPAAGIFSIALAGSSIAALSLKPTYEAQGSLLIKTDRTSSLTGVGESIGKIDSLATANNPVDTQVRVALSVPVIKETIESLQLKDDEGKLLTIRDISTKLKVEGVKGTDVLQISYTDKNPKLAAKVVNKVIDVYIKNNIKVNRAEAVYARKFIVQQLPESEKAVKKAEIDLRNFKEANRIIVLGEEASAAVVAISELNSEITQAQAQLTEITARSQSLQNQAKIDSQQAVRFATLSQVDGVQKLLTELQQAQSQLAVEQTRLQPTHPTVINLQEKVAALDNLLKQRIAQVDNSNQQVEIGNLQIGELRQELTVDFVRSEAERIGLVKRISELSRIRSTYIQRGNALPRLEQTQRELERKLEAAQKTYETLLTRLQEIQTAENQNIGNARIISPAIVPDKPKGPGKKIILGGGVLAGTLLGIMAAFALDITDKSLKSVKEARELFKYTLLGVIPNLGRNGKNSSDLGSDQPIPRVIGRDTPLFPLGDAYQMLQANLKFLASDKKLQTIVVTSSVSKEGKSEVSTNLALALAQVGHRVLLVDANMRHPVQHHIWNLTNAVGLSNVIVDQVPLTTAVYEVVNNLYVLPSGVVPPNPVALLDSKRMASLIEIFAKDYDYVVFDTPPLAGTADAAVLGKLADGILLVVNPEVVDFPSANTAKEFLNQSGQKVLGMAINAVNVKREPDSYFYYTKDSAEASSKSKNSANTKSIPSEITK